MSTQFSIIRSMDKMVLDDADAKEVSRLHRLAMDIADRAFDLERKQMARQARKLFKQAFETERKAARMIPRSNSYEPSRSVMFRSAASLALNAQLIDDAEKMVADGLLGYPPKSVARELRELFVQIYEARKADKLVA